MSRDGTLVVAFEDIDRLSASVRAHTAFVRSRVGQVARVASDPDLVASLPLSPFTAAQAEGAVAFAASRLVVHAATAESIALVSATVVSTYRLAEDSMANAAAGLGKAAGEAGAWATRATAYTARSVEASASLSVLLGAALLGLKVAVDSFVAGFGDEFVDSLVPGLEKTLEEYRDRPELLIGGGALFGAHFGANIGSSFAMNDAFANAIRRGEASLGTTGPFYDDILRALIASGNTFGFFIDRRAELGPSGLIETKMAQDAIERAEKSSHAIYGIDGVFNLDDEGRVLPSDIPSLFASGRQIDDLGKDNFATIRVITCTDDSGQIKGYTVQIPSTQSFGLWRTGAPNDLTADLHAMIPGGETSLSRAVTEAMEASGIRRSPDGPPVLITGFSLGGITAASIAAGNTGFNIRQVITAGSPIARFTIPNQVDVLAWESRQDPIWLSDGRPNPAEWTTIRRDAPHLEGESEQKLVVLNDAHDLDRYARMAADEPAAGGNTNIARYFDGDLAIVDYYVTDRQEPNASSE